MGSQASRRPTLELPADDGSLARAIDELRVKTEAWLAALREAQQAVVGQAPTTAPRKRSRSTRGVLLRRPENAPPLPPQAPPAPFRPAAAVPEPAADDGAGRTRCPAAEEEALLAGLDEQTRAAVLVKRRLCGGQKSVRELLEEVRRSGSVRQQGNSQPKRWWRR